LETVTYATALLATVASAYCRLENRCITQFASLNVVAAKFMLLFHNTVKIINMLLLQ